MADRSGTHLYLVLMKAHRTMARHAHRSIAAHDLGFSDFTILEALLHKGPMLVNEIGRRIELTSGSITTAVDRLEARGLVERSADADDRRAKQVALTHRGRTLITRIFDRHRAVLDAAADGLTRTERETLIALLKKLGLSAHAKLAEESASWARRSRSARGPDEKR
jgi:MarR family 2-MHQ and catechol resistance regulon transcriptional repressor